MERYRGRVVWFSGSKRFGFISREGAPDVFFHDRALQTPAASSLEGAEVEFDLAGPGVLQADLVVLLQSR